MNPASNKLGLYQRWLQAKFRKIEDLYYEQIDQLIHDIEALERNDVDPMDFELTKYSFILDWEQGLIPSAKVLDVMEMMNLEAAAKAKIIKRLQNYMLKHEFLAETIKPIIAELNGECVDAMVEYLTMMRRMVKKMVEIDDQQIKVSWVQQFFKKDQGPELVSEEMTLNQTIRHIATYIDQSAGQRFHLGDQIIVFDEEVGHEDRAVHWLFAPRTYIELIRYLFNIKESLGKDEIEFLKNLIKDVE